MRYYKIVITDPKTGAVFVPKSLVPSLGNSLNATASYTSFVNGKTLPGALKVELDVSTFDFATPTANAQICIFGVSLEEIGQANDLAGKNIAVYAGMQKGLPLANPKQSGLILKGYVLYSFGNWIDTAMTLNLIVAAGNSPDGTGSAASPKNFQHSWKKGSPLSDAIKNTLSTAFPGYTADINISSKLVLTEDDPGYYEDITQYAQYVQNTSRAIVGGDYQGVRITLRDKVFLVFDGTTQTAPKQLLFQDLIGQPTWINPLTLQFKCVMRADIAVGDFVKMPLRDTQFTTTAEGATPSGSSLKASSIFQGSFLVNKVRHVGSSRQPDAASWVTIFDASTTQA